jgi:heavy metal translocating P-type ATPase
LSLADVLAENKVPIAAIAVCVVLALISTLDPDYELLALVPVVICGIPIAREVIEDFRELRISAETLVISAIIGCVILGEYLAAAEIAILMSLGGLLEEMVGRTARSGLESLGSLRVQHTHVIDGEDITDAPTDSVRIGSRIRVLPGETIPLDGIIIQGRSSLNKMVITGESVPVDVTVGDEVMAGTGNLQGSLDIEVTRTDADSTVSRLEELLKDASAGKSRIVNAADKWAKWILLTAAVLTVSVYILTGDVYRALTIMVVFCPCAFVLATPTGVMATAGNMVRNGVLLRNTDAIEGLASVDTVLLDKTGTLTEGKIVSRGYTDVSSGIQSETMEGMMSALESRSEHPLGRAIAMARTPCGDVGDFSSISGQGVRGIVDGKEMFMGNRTLMESFCRNGLEEVLAQTRGIPSTVVYVGLSGSTVGYVTLEDRIKDTSASAVDELRSEGLRTVMITGDSSAVGRSVTEELGLDDVVWECLPETKLRCVEHFEKDGHVCMIGDGVNDAPSLKRATVGISMGTLGNDIAVESSDIVLMNDDLGTVPGLVRLCRRSVLTIHTGLALAMGINIAGAALAAVGWLDPIAGAVMHNMGSLAVILLSSTLLWTDTWTARGQPKLDKRRYPALDHEI